MKGFVIKSECIPQVVRNTSSSMSYEYTKLFSVPKLKKKVYYGIQSQMYMFKSLIKIVISSEFIFDLCCLTIYLLENKQKK